MDPLYVIAHLTIASGKGNEFKRLAAQALEVCKAKDTKTLAYEWFTNDAQTECFVLETYVDSEGLASHMRDVGSTLNELRSIVTVQGHGFGAPSAELLQALQGRMKFAARFAGLALPTRHASADPAMALRAVATFKIHPGKTEEFKRIGTECAEAARAKDRGTAAYEWFMNDEGTEATVLEAYDDSQAVLDHMRNIGHIGAALPKVCDMSINMFGSPSSEMLTALRRMPIKVYGRLQGLGA